MDFEHENLSTMLEMTNVLPLPDDWFSRPGDYGLYRAYEIAGPTPVQPCMERLRFQVLELKALL